MAATTFSFNNAAAQAGVTIDGVSYNNIIWSDLKRSFSVLDNENTGRTVSDGRMHRDIIGTFYNYSLSLRAKVGSEAEYDQVYKILSKPVASHRVILPFGQGSIAFDAYVTNGEDALIRRNNGRSRWHNLEISFIAMERVAVTNQLYSGT